MSTLTFSSRRAMMLRVLGRRFGYCQGASSLNFDALAATTDIDFDDNHNHRQVRYNWAPPAYRKQDGGSFNNQQKKTRRSGGINKQARRVGRSRSPSSKRHRIFSNRDNKIRKSSFPEIRPSSRDAHDSSKDSRREEKQGIKLLLLQENLMELLDRYQTMIEDEVGSTDHEEKAKSLVHDDNHDVELWWSQIKTVLSHLNNIETLNESMNAAKLRDTQQTYEELCRLMHRLIVAWIKKEYSQRDGEFGIVEKNRHDEEEEKEEEGNDEAVGSHDETPPKPHDVAEKLLLAFLKFISGRAQLVSSLQPSQNEGAKVQRSEVQEQSWADWLYNTFVQSPGEEQQDTKKNTDVRDEQQEKYEEEEDFTYKPSKRLLLDVFQCIIDGTHRGTVLANDDIKDVVLGLDHDHFYWKRRIIPLRRPFPSRRKIRRELAQRLTLLLDQVVIHLPDHKVNPFLLDLVLQAHAQVGLYESASEAERLYNQYWYYRLPAMNFHTVLKAYRLASSMEKAASLQTKAATRAEELLRKRQENANRNRQRKHRQVDDRSDTDSPRMAPMVTVMSYKLVLQALANAGVDAIPDISERADRLMELLMRKEEFQKLLDGSWDQLAFQPDLGLLHYLIVIYALSEQDDRIERAKQLLRYMETKSTERSHRHSLSKPQDATDEEAIVFPNSWSYNAVLSGLLRQSNKRGNDPQILANANFGTDLLDTIATPDRYTFSMVLKLWAKSKSLQSGEQAENILSRMEISSACSGYAWTIDHLTYTAALRCWCQAAASGQPGAAQSAKKLLEKMQAQCRPVSNVANDFVSKSLPHAELTAFYREDLRPSLSDYNWVIETCAKTHYSRDRDVALEVAFDTYNDMIESGIRHSPNTYCFLLMCCSNLLQDEPVRRMELSSRVFQSACDQNKIKRRVLKELQKANPDLYNSYQQSRGRGTDGASATEQASGDETTAEHDGNDAFDSDDDETVLDSSSDFDKAAVPKMEDSGESQDDDKETVLHLYLK